jgi:hypothetical protein
MGLMFSDGHVYPSASRKQCIQRYIFLGQHYHLPLVMLVDISIRILPSLNNQNDIPYITLLSSLA